MATKTKSGAETKKPTKANKAKSARKPAKKPESAASAKTDADLVFSKNRIDWTINNKVYPLEVVQQAAYLFIDRAYLLLDLIENGKIKLSLKGKQPMKKAELEALQGEFSNELLNQAVRRQLARQNKRLRELIVAKALFAASRPDELRQMMDSVADKAGPSEAVPRPWDKATKEEQDELDRLLAEIEKDFADDPMGIAVPWDEKYGDKDKPEPEKK